ncbi:patatin-like phospholipase domain-containing protein 4 isoform X4 [Haplochromis burtoni]|uniref:patatin-like phospholipase domain-containing protein 4 isoform X4 n=2 Tax=Haplochromini TaxID=319058 RepID=UPI001C2DF129|nr:patatin-like phospholipase domain-containing protein 4 isoform X4 [Haplochromis burtoni]
MCFRHFLCVFSASFAFLSCYTITTVLMMTVLNLSFAACGFLGIYHLGAMEAFLRHGHKLLGSLGACAGASAGALVAAVMVTAPEKLEHCKDFTYRFADGVRQQRFGAVTPGYNFMLTLREGIEEILPTEAHSLATDRLYVSITHSESGTNHSVSTFTSREELIKVLLASCFVPVYAGLKPVELRGKHITGPLQMCSYCWKPVETLFLWFRNGLMEDSLTACRSCLWDEPSRCHPLLDGRMCVRSTGGGSKLNSAWPT